MSLRRNILDGSDAINKDFGLVYTCNLGWLDLGHMNPNSTRAHTGAATLWREINAGGPDVRHCNGAHKQICTMPSRTKEFPAATFADEKATGFRITYKQEQFAFKMMVSTGIRRKYIVRHNLTIKEKRSVALAIFMEVSMEFEEHQNFFPKFLTDSGFSQEDLVSNLIGFHIAVGTVTKAEVLAMAKPVSQAAALAIWDKNGPVGSNKNRGFQPLFKPTKCSTAEKSCIDECKGIVPRPPDFLTSILPAKKGELFMNNMLGSS